MGYFIAIGHCFSCKRPFSFNPDLVPSIRINGVRQPICRQCIERANPLRKVNGLPEVKIHPDAYEPTNEGGDYDN